MQTQMNPRIPRRFASTSMPISDAEIKMDRLAREINFSYSNLYSADDWTDESTSAPKKKTTDSPVKVRNLKEEAATQFGSTVERLLITQYPNTPAEEEEWASFESTYYVSNSSTQKSKGITRDDYASVAEHLAREAAFTNAAISLLKYVAINAKRIAASEDPAKLISQQWALLTVLINDTRVTEWAADFLNACAVGNSQVIRQVKDAYVVMFTGIPKSGLNQGQGNDAPIPQSTSDYAYKELAGDEGPFQHKLGKAAIEAVKMLLSDTLEDKASTNFANSVKRMVVTSPLGDFSQAATINMAFRLVQKATGIPMPTVELPSIGDNLKKGVGRYMLAVAMKEADEGLVRRKLAAKDTKPDDQLGHSPDLVALNSVISFTFAMRVPIGVARYISQVNAGEQVSLVALNMWASVWASGMLTRGRKKGTRINGRTIRALPRYVLPASKTKELSDRRKAVGYYTEKGKSNKENIFIAANGTLQYLPPADDVVLDNAVAFEQLLENSLAEAFAAGTPLPTGSARSIDPVFELNNPGLIGKIQESKHKLDKYMGSIQSYSWDYNTILTTSTAEAAKVVSHSLIGATKPNSMFIADYMRKPFGESMALMFPNSSHESDEDTKGPTAYGHTLSTSAGMLKMSPFRSAFALYDYLAHTGAAPDFKSLLAEAAKQLGIKNLAEGDHAPYENGLYRKVIASGLGLIATELDPVSNDPRPQSWFIRSMLEDALKDAEGGPKSNLVMAVLERNRKESTGDAYEDDPHFFSATHTTLKQFSNVFNYLGGRVFQLMLQSLTKADRRKYMVVDTDNPFGLPSFTQISTEVMPLAVMFGTYVNVAPKLYAEADAIIESNTADEGFSADDIHLPGSKEGYSLFPHQLDGFKKLSRAPEFAILDVSPGGGKTTSILTDIGMMLHNGKAKKFLVMAPTRLGKNWIDDMRQHTSDNWNFIPITTAVFKKWGEDGLAKMIENAPPNTIVVVGNDWLSKTRGQQIVLGRHVEKISTTVELIKRFQFDYIAIDESHRAKRMYPVSSRIHAAMKSITTASSTKYLRLATGTLISNTLKDVVGQVALYSAAIFRTPQEFEDANREQGVGLGGRMSQVYMHDAAKRAREHLSKYATVITTRRREWAFMLPTPIDTFAFVRLAPIDKDGNTDAADEAHKVMYEALFKNTIEDIRSNPELMAMLTGKSAEEDDDIDDEEADKVVGNALTAALSEPDQDDDTLDELSAALGPYLQRLEMAIIDPVGDRDAFGNEFGSVFFKGLDMENYKSAKVRKVIERIEKHYETFPWKPGQNWKDGAYADHEGKRYMFKGKSGYRSIKPPAEDQAVWKPQAYGKCLVFCRYVRSVEAIFNALPANLKKSARMFYGSLGTAWANLEEVKSSAVADPRDVISGKAAGAQILIANEQAISEGHNLQMASRMIRVELPWAPGELDQSSARIFRPDPSGKNNRDHINLDWVISEGTLEVAKLGCLISKILTKAQFDEADNPFRAEDDQGNSFSYKDLNKANLPTIKMSLKNIENIRWRENLKETGSDGRDIDYLAEYAKFAMLQGAEFDEMRAKRKAKMIPIEPTPMPKGSSKMEFQPYLPAQKVVGHDDWGLVLLSEYLQNDKDPAARRFINDKSELKSQLVHTEFGNGIIIGVRSVPATNAKNASETDSGDPTTKLSSVRIQLAGTNEIITLDADVVHLARNLNAQQIREFAPKEFWVKTAADKKRVKQAEEEEVAENKRQGKRVRDEVKREREEIAIAKRVKAKAPIRKSKPVEDEAFDDEGDSVELYPVVYNGFFAVEGKSDTEEEASVLKKFGFKPFGDYAYIKIPNFATYNAIMDYIDAKFDTSDLIYNRLVSCEDSFVSGRGRAFDIALAPLSEFKSFYVMSHKASAAKGKNGKPELKLYPMVIGQNLFFVADMATNAIAVRKLLAATIPGSKTKFGVADGMFVKFFSNKTEMKSKVLEIKRSGVVISNLEEFSEAFAELKTAAKPTPTPSKTREVRDVKKTTKAVPAAPVKKQPAPPPKKAPVKAGAKKVIPAAKGKPAAKPAGKKPTVTRR